MVMRIRSSLSEVGRARSAVAVAALLALFGKLAIAADTGGTTDVRIFAEFARSIGRVGPVHVYGLPRAGSLVYNHGPLTGIMLDLFDRLWRHGFSFPLLIRTPACVADFATSLIVFELARERVGVRRALWCGIAVALSPVLVGVSGFHGNTDPVFVCLVLLSAWLLTSNRSLVGAGACLALALSVKIVPVVVVPVLLIAAAQRGRRNLALFLAGLGGVLALLWGMPLFEYFHQVKANVLDYQGSPYRPWGVPKFFTWLGLPHSWLQWWVGPGHVSVVLVSAGIGSLLVWRRPNRLAMAVAASLVAVLVFSTAGADQYLAWPAAAVFLLDFWSGIAYTVFAGVFLTELYSRWSHGFPWGTAFAHKWTHHELMLAAVAWGALAVNLVLGARTALGHPLPRVEPEPAPALARESAAESA